VTDVVRVVLLRQAGTPATRRGDFPADELLSVAGHRLAGSLSAYADGAAAWVSPAARAGETAELAGLAGARVDDRLRPLGAGSWAGRTLRDVGTGEPGAIARWLADPDARPPGGESIRELTARVADLLEEWRGGVEVVGSRTRPGTRGDRRIVAVTHAGVVRAAVLLALRAPVESFSRVDVAPGSATELHTRGDGWAVVAVNRPPA
jgi:broad specificity phosphatase PhoE